MVFRECGCRTYMTDHPNLFVPMVEYCPMHEAAPDLYEVLKELMYEWHAHTGDNYKCAERAIAKAEGKDE